MRKINRVITTLTMGLTLLGASLFLGACSGTWNVTVNTPPSVTVVLSKSTVNSGETFTATATATDAQNDSLSYTWYVDDVAQSGATAASFSTSITENVTDSAHTIKVVVSDGSLTGTASVGLTVKTANTAPTVTLSSSATTVYSDQTFTLTASASDAENDTLSYTWYLDDALQSVTTASTGAYFLEKTSDAYHTVKLTVADAYHTVTKTLSIYVYATGSLRVINQDTLALQSLCMRTTGLTSWGVNQLDSNIAVNATYILFAITPSTYDAVIYDTSNYSFEKDSYAYSAGTPRTWTIYNLTSDLANRKGLSLAPTFTDGSELTATAGTRDASVICIDASKR